MELFDELFGFLIVLFALLFPLFRKILSRRNQKDTPPRIQEEEWEEEEIEERERVKTNIGKPIQKRLPSPLRSKGTQRLLKQGEYDFHSDLEEMHKMTEIEKRHLESNIAPKFNKSVVSEEFFPEREVKKRKKNLTIAEIVKKKGPFRSMVVLSEVLGKPKSLQTFDEHH